MITPEVGKTYIVRHTTGRVEARCLAIKEAGHRRREHYRFLNLASGREIELKSRQRILRSMEPEAVQPEEAAPANGAEKEINEMANTKTKKKGAKPTKAAAAAQPKKQAKASAKKKAPAEKPAKAPRDSKKATAIGMLEAGPTTLAQLEKKLGWQSHSVRGFLSTLNKSRKIRIEKGEDGTRTYQLAVAK